MPHFNFSVSTWYDGTGEHSADQHQIGEGGGWWWMDVSDDKISNCMKMSVPSICRTSRWWGHAMSPCLLSCEICCGRPFSEASWGYLSCQHPWLEWKNFKLVWPLVPMRGFMFFWWQTWYSKAEYVRTDLYWRTSQIDLISTIWLYFDIWLFPLLLFSPLILWYFRFLWCAIVTSSLIAERSSQVMKRGNILQKTPTENRGLQFMVRLGLFYPSVESRGRVALLSPGDWG